MRHKQPLSIYSIPEDIDAWRNDFSYPLRLYENDLFFEQMYREVAESYADCPDSDKAVYRICSLYAGLALGNLLCQCVVAGRTAEDAWDFSDWRRIKPAARPNNILMLREGKLPSCFFVPNLARRQHPALASLRGSIAEIRNGKWVPSFLADAVVVAPNETTQHYLSLQPYRRVCAINELMVLGHPVLSSKIMDGSFWKQWSWQLASTAGHLAVDHGGVWNPDLEKAVAQTLLHSVAYMQSDLEAARKFSRRFRRGTPVVTGTGGNYLSRLLGTAFVESGSTVLGTPHGGGTSNGAFSYASALGELTTCSHFLCLHENEASEYKKLPRIADIEYVVAPDFEPSLLDAESFKENAPYKSPAEADHIVFVMLNFYPADSFAHCLPPDVVQLDLQLEVINRLLKMGKRVTVKNRAKTAYISKDFNHFGYFGDKVEYTCRPMAEVAAEAEAMIFQMIGSFSLYEGMTLSQAPVVLLDTGFPEPTESFKPVEEIRISRILLKEQENGRLTFEDHDFDRIFGGSQ